MSIRFPDFQILVSRSDQVPKVHREGDPTGAAGRVAPQVSQEFAARERRVERNKEKTASAIARSAGAGKGKRNLASGPKPEGASMCGPRGLVLWSSSSSLRWA